MPYQDYMDTINEAYRLAESIDEHCAELEGDDIDHERRRMLSSSLTTVINRANFVSNKLLSIYGQEDDNPVIERLTSAVLRAWNIIEYAPDRVVEDFVDE